jgi:hypothetical protein
MEVVRTTEVVRITEVVRTMEVVRTTEEDRTTEAVATRRMAKFFTLFIYPVYQRLGIFVFFTD